MQGSNIQNVLKISNNVCKELEVYSVIVRALVFDNNVIVRTVLQFF